MSPDHRRLGILLGAWLTAGAGAEGQSVSLAPTPIWSPQPTAPSAFGWSIDVADGDGDGVLDLAVSAPDVNFGTGEVWVLRGPDFLTGVKVDRPPVVGIHDVYGINLSFDDLDLDGFADLVIHDREMTGANLGRLWVAYGPTFSPAIRVPKGVGYEGWYQGASWDVGDANHDGWPDLVTGSSVPGAGGLSVHLGPGGFSLPPTKSLQAPYPIALSWGRAVLVEDVDGDGKNEVVTTEAGFAPPAYSLIALENLDPSQSWKILHTSIPYAGIPEGPLHFADVDENGAGDVVAGATTPYDPNIGQVNTDHSVMVFYGPSQASAVLLQQAPISPKSEFGSAIDTGDVNRDGHLDLVVGASNAMVFNGKDGRVTIFYGPGLTQTQEIDAAGPGVRLGNDVAVRDLDGNGFAELFIASEGAAVVLLYRHRTLRALGSTDVSVSLGGQVVLSTECGRLSGGRPFLVLTSVSGTTPGLDVPHGSGVVHVPINLDAVTALGIGLANGPLFQNFQGTLDAAGSAASLFSLPAGLAGPSLVGLSLQLCAVTADPFGAIDYATDPVAITLVP